MAYEYAKTMKALYMSAMDYTIASCAQPNLQVITDKWLIALMPWGVEHGYETVCYNGIDKMLAVRSAKWEGESCEILVIDAQELDKYHWVHPPIMPPSELMPYANIID